MLTTHCTYLCCQIIICMEITKIHQWQILASLDHSSLIVHLHAKVQKTVQCEIVSWSFCIYTAGKHKVVSTAAHFWENILQVTGMSAWIE